MNKVYLCHSDSVFDVAAFEVAYTENPIAQLTKADLYESIDIMKAEMNLVKEAEDLIEKAEKAPTGHTWSQELQRKNMPARWITYGGNKILIKMGADGKGRVIFSANPSLEHLVITPRTQEEYEKIKKEKKEREEKRRAKAEVTPEQIKREKEIKKIAAKKSKEVTRKFREKLINVFGDHSEITSKDIREIEGKLEKKAERILEREKAKEAKELMGDIADKVIDMKENERKRADKALIEAAEKILSKDARGELIDKPIETKVGDEEVDKKIDLLRQKMTKDDAIEIVTAKDRQKTALKEIRDEFKDDMVIPKGNLELTSTQGIGIGEDVDFDAPVEGAKDKAVEAALKSEENRIRANLNTELYKELERRDGKKSTIKEMASGAKDTINAMAGEYLEGASLNDEVIEFIGVKNAARVIANSVSSRKDDAATAKKIETQLKKKSKEVVEDVVKGVHEKEKRIDNYNKQKDENTLAGSTANAAIARQYGALGRDLGFAVGSLETAATVLDSLRDIKGATGDIVVDGGKSIGRIKEKLEGMGLDKGDYKITNAENKGRTGRYDVTIKKEAHEKMLTKNTFSKQRDAIVKAIKSGMAHEEGWNPKGTPKTFVDFKTKEQYKKLERTAKTLESKRKAGDKLSKETIKKTC